MIELKLSAYRDIEAEISVLEHELKHWRDFRERAFKMFGRENESVYGAERDKFNEVSVKIRDVEDHLFREICSLAEKRLEIEISIEKLPSPERTILRKFYIEGDKLEEIAEKLRMSHERIKSIRDGAIALFSGCQWEV